MTLDRFRAKFAELSIWWYAFGYFALYIPYSALTKALSDGLIPGSPEKLSGFVLLPLLGIGSMVANWGAISALDWWRFAGRRTVLGISIPWPGGGTFVAGLCTALIIPTTSMAYTFTGVSILFIMLLMRGGVLIIAPMVDFVSGRRVHWYSWTALLMAIAALWVGMAGRGYAITAVALANAAVYVTAYFIRLRAMSRLTKSDDRAARMRYFVEEQIVAPPVNVLLLAFFAVVGAGDAMLGARAGFTTFLAAAPLIVGGTFLAGVISQITGICATLTLMDRRENTFCVPVNRASSLLSGVAASLLLWAIAGARAPGATEYAGAALIVAAMLVLALGPTLGRAHHAPAAPAAPEAGAEHADG
jgi:hypothetical protein